MMQNDFMKDVSGHLLSAFIDAGPLKVLHFEAPQSITHWFEIVTWKGHLAVGGDHGTFVFSRWGTDDMMTFFRDAGQPGAPLRINLDYWYEKLVSDDRRTPAKEYSELRLRALLAEALEQYAESNTGADVEALEAEFNDITGETEEEARDALSTLDEQFDVWGWDLTDYSDNFMWCCFAIVWAIRHFDALCDRRQANGRY